MKVLSLTAFLTGWVKRCDLNCSAVTYLANEFDIIAKYFAPLVGPEGLSLKDDAAVITPKLGRDLVVTKDLLVEGRHFFKGADPERLAKKVLGVNLSDLAAKGAEPEHYFLGLVLPENISTDWLSSFSSGLEACQKEFGFTLAGGDTTATTGPLTISVTIMGTLPTGTMIKRSGAVVGDGLYVTGTLGDAALGLRCLTENIDTYPELIGRYHEPQPRLGVGIALRSLASACADVSDGLVADAGHVCTASGVGATIQVADLPLSLEAQSFLDDIPSSIDQVYSGGDDYELVFTAPPNKEGFLKEVAVKTGVSITKIGVIEGLDGIRLVDQAGNLVHVNSEGYKHFQ